ncbi:MAG TPA: nucleotide exchange factor GrpE [Prolixibacteraceae bacterium]|nr:nucleotide exchange factor GrpE [Prolixibacteraceae bacterium]HPS12069.1 nucleotide exchange factor GrpE [Prolixibacteraceae bacterium]
MEEEKIEKENIIEQNADKQEENTSSMTSEEDKKEEAASRKSKKLKKDKNAEIIESLENSLAQKNDQFLRLHAEFDNYRKRTLKEKMELTKSAGEGILLNILPVIDDFERALKAMETANDVDSVKEGINLIYKRFSDFVKMNGVKEIDAKEKDFDTDLHEAITKIPSPTEELKGKVVDVIQKGYTLNDKVIRFAKVVIGE